MPHTRPQRRVGREPASVVPSRPLMNGNAPPWAVQQHSRDRAHRRAVANGPARSARAFSGRSSGSGGSDRSRSGPRSFEFYWDDLIRFLLEVVMVHSSYPIDACPYFGRPIDFGSVIPIIVNHRDSIDNRHVSPPLFRGCPPGNELPWAWPGSPNTGIERVCDGCSARAACCHCCEGVRHV